MAGKQTEPVPAPEPVKVPALARAAESTDPTVHALVADLTGLRQDNQTDAVASVVARLEGLGFTA